MFADDYSECLVKDYPDVGSLVHETLSCAVIDSGCTRTVLGSSWINCYKETTENQLKKMKISKCNIPFCFGDGEIINSQTIIDISGRVGNSNVLISANAVDIELPLLLSKPSQKKVDVVINFAENTMFFAGEKIELLETSSGHYAIALCYNNKIAVGLGYIRKPELILAVSEETLLGENNEQIRKKALKLHHQFAYCTANQLKKLLKNAGFGQEKYFNMIKITENCEFV